MQQYNHIITNPPRQKPTLSEAKYGIDIHQKVTGLSKTLHSTISYNLDIETNSRHSFSTWKKSNIRINDSVDTLKMDSVYLKVAEPLNDLNFGLDNNRKIKEIYNHRAILKNWKNQRSSILKQYKGDVVELLVKKMTDKLSDYDTLKKSVSRDLVLQHITGNTLNDHLIYYGSHKDNVQYSGLIDPVSLPFKRTSTLGLKNDKLHLQSKAELNIEKIDTQKVAHYFKNKVEDFDTQNLKATIISDLQLDYNSIWIEDAHITHTVWVTHSNYKKEITLAIKKIHP
ncbi:hypothetical protein [Aquimarina algiphila]|uniref:hypothetical protein n=1 Tax=Aquimarina algiphila TaxID=2047982 RepID=UPI00232D82B4|nr:hypothetical protein [Aquimarina algiphila]